MNDLTERLRELADQEDSCESQDIYCAKDLREATDALEAKDKEIERLTAERDHYREQYMRYYHEAADHIADNERLRAALERTHDHIKAGRYHMAAVEGDDG